MHIHSKNVFKETALPGFVDIWSPMIVHMGGEVISDISGSTESQCHQSSYYCMFKMDF